MAFDRVAVVSGSRAAGWCQSMAAEVVQALRIYGVKTHLVDVDALASFCESDIDACRGTVFVDFNHRTVFPWRQRIVSLMLDHPCSLMKELSRPDVADTVTGWVDASHPEALSAVGFGHRALFLPHAGPAATAKIAPFDEREIDIFFAGSLAEPTDRAAWREANPAAAPQIADLLFDAVDLVESATMAVIPAVLAVLDRRGIAPSQFTRDDFGTLIATVLTIAEENRRVNILTALPDHLNVVVAARYLPRILRDRPNIRYLGYIDDFDRIRGLIRNTRILLNTTLKFPAGSHERIWNAMAEGTVVLTDPSVFMAQDFSDGENILYLPQKCPDAAALARLAGIAQDRAQLARLAESATARYRERHTWTKRAPLLIEALRAA